MDRFQGKFIERNIMKGKDILQKEYPEDEERFRDYLRNIQTAKAGLIKAISNFKGKLDKENELEKEMLEMTLEEWLKIHPK